MNISRLGHKGYNERWYARPIAIRDSPSLCFGRMAKKSYSVNNTLFHLSTTDIRKPESTLPHWCFTAHAYGHIWAYIREPCRPRPGCHWKIAQGTRKKSHAVEPLPMKPLQVKLSTSTCPRTVDASKVYHHAWIGLPILSLFRYHHLSSHAVRLRNKKMQPWIHNLDLAFLHVDDYLTINRNNQYK